MNILILLAILLGLIAAGGLTDLVQHNRGKLLIALDLCLWACFFYLLYLIGV